MRAQDIMTTDVVTAKPATTVREVANLMTKHRISGVPVVDAFGQVVGIITDGDLYRRAELGTDKRRTVWLSLFGTDKHPSADYVATHGRSARDVMTADVIAVAPETSLRQIADIFEKKRIRRVPVVADGKLVGIVSRANLVQALSAISMDQVAQADSDSRIRDLVIAEYKRLCCGLPPESNVIVKDGFVHLWGFVPSLADLAALRVAAEGVPGVKGFIDLTFGDRGKIGEREEVPSQLTVIGTDGGNSARIRHKVTP